MIIGQTIVATPDGVTTVYYGPWFHRNGNLAVMACDVIATSGLGAFVIDVQTKNTDESDKTVVNPNSGASNSITLTANTVTNFQVGAALTSTALLGFKELVRFKYGITASGAGNGWVHFRILNPAWLTN